MGYIRRRPRLSVIQVRNVVVVVAGILLQRESNHQAMASIQNGVCDLECPVNIGAKCAFGESPYLLDSSMSPPVSSSTTTPTSLNGMHCTCPDSYTGIQCEFSFDSCNDKNQHVCYHGGICKSGAVDTYGNVQHYCDCSKAVDATTKLPYVGKYCELATVLTCDDSNDPNPLCFNGGICNEKYPSFGDPCLCSGGHSGPHCEYAYGDNATLVNKQGLVVEQNVDTFCNLTCANGGVCVRGKRNATDQADEYLYWINEENLNDNMFCQCADGWDGPACTIEKVVCGSEHCFFGGTCQTRSDNVDGDNPTITHHCDCTTANNADESYAGRFCQYKATEYCTKDPGLNGELFCVNHGICRANAHEGCDCPNGYTGFSCEFKTATTSTNDNVEVVDESDQLSGRPVLDPTESTLCTMECKNGGTCRHGPKSLGGGLDLFAGNTSYLNEEVGTSNDFQHCVCPNNFAGTYCETPLDSCGAGKHLCVNGGKCVDLGSEQLCNCDEIDSPLATFFAGNHCEHPVNDICTETTSTSVSPSSIVFSNTVPGSSVAYCVNGGTCKATVPLNEPHPGCHCPDGYLGPHCELRQSSDVPDTRENDPYFNQQVSTFDNSRVNSYRRRRRRQNAAITDTLKWSAPNFRDGGSTEINFAPKRGSVQYSDDGNSSPYEDAIVASTSSTNYGEQWSSAVAIRTSARDFMTFEPNGHNSLTGSVDVDENEDDDMDSPDDHYSLPQIDIGPRLMKMVMNSTT